MAKPDIDAHVDQLYQLPLDQFTGARNTLAKELKRPQIKNLEKPSIAAWAVNQLYWKERDAYDELVGAGERLRIEHRNVLGGKSADIRASEQAHREAIRAALGKIKRLLNDGGHATTDATLTSVQETLEALPSDTPPGRLVKSLKPKGFEALAGIPSISVGARSRSGAGPDGAKGRPASTPLKLVRSASDEKRERDEAKRREKDERERQERRREADKELKAAEAAMLQAEDAVKKAEKTLGELRMERDEAVNAYQRARLRARE
jgi:hypothetical protein